LEFGKDVDASKVDGVEGEHDVIIARAEHPCDEDFYKSVYRMKMSGSEVEKFVVEHQVKGPSKDYVSTTWYTRSTEDA